MKLKAILLRISSLQPQIGDVPPELPLVVVRLAIRLACAAVNAPHGFCSNLVTSRGVATGGAVSLPVLAPEDGPAADAEGDGVALPVVEVEHAARVSPTAIAAPKIIVRFNAGLQFY